MDWTGFHGTSTVSADLIDTEGFKPSGGWRGTGVYFWEQTSESGDTETQLAHLWCKCRRTEWAKQGDSGCVVYSAKIESKVPTLNLHDRKCRDAFLAFASATASHAGDRLKSEDRCLIFDLFIDAAEEDRGVEIKLVRADDMPPRATGKDGTNPIYFLNSYRVLVVRDVDCILSKARI